MLLDAAVHASGASKKLISPFVPTSAAKRKNTIDSADKKYKKEKQTRKTGIQATISFQKINCIAEGLPLSNSLCLLVAQAVIPCRSSV